MCCRTEGGHNTALPASVAAWREDKQGEYLTSNAGYTKEMCNHVSTGCVTILKGGQTPPLASVLRDFHRCGTQCVVACVTLRGKATQLRGAATHQCGVGKGDTKGDQRLSC